MIKKNINNTLMNNLKTLLKNYKIKQIKYLYY